MASSSYASLLLLIFVIVCVVSANTLVTISVRLLPSSSEEPVQSGDYFLRSAKWVSKMSPSGGSLVSGRGGFRPGFTAQDWRAAIAEPSFVKRSRSDIYDY